MTLVTKTTSVLGYRVLSTSILAFLTYVAIFITLAVTDKLPNVPEPQNQGGLHFEKAYEDLHHITAHPHPYISHANDDVRNYLLSRLIPLAEAYPHVHLSDDLISNGSWASTSYGVYFEGTNILVKIDGTSAASRGGVLFSAHYDSVSTAPGTADDGMGVATILQLVKYFAENRTKRSAIFNINNGEEDWLNGAHAFLQHPWSELADTFLNLEGAAAGGRPILFRATSTSPVRSFRNTKLVPHPHANVLSSDAFSRGLIRSGTDYSVYAGPGARGGMNGLDLAFYKGRSRYHTKYDAIQYTLGGQKSLWSMMEVARGVGIGLLDAPIEDSPKVDAGTDEPVYFDLFKSFVVVFPLASLLTFNVVLLVVGPILLILLIACEKVIIRRQHDETHDEPEDSHPHHSGHNGHSHLNHHEHTDTSIVDSLRLWLYTAWTHAKFWVAIGVAVGFQVLLIWAYVAINPFAIYSSPYIILLSFLTLAYLILVSTLTLPSSLPFYRPKVHSSSSDLEKAQYQKHTVFLHLYLFTWILLVLSTLGITRVHPGIGSGYLITAWNTCVGIGCMFAAIESLVSSPSWRVGDDYDELEDESEDDDGHLSHGRHHHHRHGEDADETTPLILREPDAAHPHHHIHAKEHEGGLATWWWIPQFLASVPLPVILLAHVTLLVLDSMPQTLADGASAWGVYTLTSLPAMLLVIPLVPFAYKLQRSRLLSIFVFVVFLSTTLYALLAFPFSVDAPLKVYFRQRIEFSDGSTAPPKVITALTGPQRYILQSLVPYLPSSQDPNKVLLCKDDEARLGLMTCEWESGARMMPTPGSYTPATASTSAGSQIKDRFLETHVTTTGPSSARFRVKGRNTRACRLYFDSAPIHEYVVQNGDAGGMQEGYEVGPKGVKEVRLWSRTWEREFRVDVSWANGTSSGGSDAVKSRTGRVACEWAEYESGMVDNGAILDQDPRRAVGEEVDGRPKIPALEEVLDFLPDWATVSKHGDGLVEAWVSFTL